MTTAFASIVRFCTICRGEMAFEQPDCVDDHAGDCPEWVCVECGDAVLVGFVLPEPARVLRATRHVA